VVVEPWKARRVNKWRRWRAAFGRLRALLPARVAWTRIAQAQHGLLVDSRVGWLAVGRQARPRGERARRNVRGEAGWPCTQLVGATRRLCGSTGAGTRRRNALARPPCATVGTAHAEVDDEGGDRCFLYLAGCIPRSAQPSLGEREREGGREKHDLVLFVAAQARVVSVRPSLFSLSF
jgi:hypothetical protein